MYHYRITAVPSEAVLPKDIARKIEESVKRQMAAVRASQRPPLPISEITGWAADAVGDPKKIPASALLNQSAAMLATANALRGCLRQKVPGYPTFIVVEDHFAEGAAVMLDMGAKQLDQLLTVLEYHELAE